jgi:hypothetical protein
MPWANNRIRTNYFASIARSYEGLKWNTSVTLGFDPEDLANVSNDVQAEFDKWEGLEKTSLFNLKRVSYF